MGHSHCGGIHGLMAPETIAGETYIQDWVGIASPALERLKLLRAMKMKRLEAATVKKAPC